MVILKSFCIPIATITGWGVHLTYRKFCYRVAISHAPFSFENGSCVPWCHRRSDGSRCRRWRSRKVGIFACSVPMILGFTGVKSLLFSLARNEGMDP